MSFAASHTRRLAASSVEPREWWKLQTPPAQPEPVSPLDSLETAGTSRRCVFHKGTGGRECHTWQGFDSLRESPHEARERAYQWFMQWRCRVPVPASTNAPFWAASPGSGTFSRPPSLTSRR
ncbi:hypothetical protein GWK47_010713 [Chionoecetes opilio]|uniref:Uncharacterized protein n=1 Tax=Chionoecetes opilio TaxID=41210 RepID=A0A8J4Y2A3_CHIOP|nr:hypothetical protein GWK47_010713 [Chionoecetes opilio]